MTTEEIKIGNKLIVKFMKTDTVPHDHQGIYFYDQSWDWLIPVVSKIYDLDDYYEYKKEVSGQFETAVKINTKYIEETYKDVINFLKWYYGRKNK